MSKNNIIKSIAPILDKIIHNRKLLTDIAKDLDELFDKDNAQYSRDGDRINKLFAAIECLKEAENFISEC